MVNYLTPGTYQYEILFPGEQLTLDHLLWNQAVENGQEHDLSKSMYASGNMTLEYRSTDHKLKDLRRFCEESRKLDIIVDSTPYKR